MSLLLVLVEELLTPLWGVRVLLFFGGSVSTGTLTILTCGAGSDLGLNCFWLENILEVVASRRESRLSSQVVLSRVVGCLGSNEYNDDCCGLSLVAVKEMRPRREEAAGE